MIVFEKKGEIDMKICSGLLFVIGVFFLILSFMGGAHELWGSGVLFKCYVLSALFFLASAASSLLGLLLEKK